MRYTFVGLGDIVTDAFIKLKDGVHVEEEVTGKELCINFGDKLEYEDVTVVAAVGNAPNASVSAHRLGLSTALVTDLGDDDFGKEKLKALEAEGVSTEFVDVHEGMQSNYHYVLRFGPERTILIKHHEYPYAVPEFAEAPEWIYFSSVGEHGIEYHHELATYCKENNVKLAFQPGSFQISLGAEKLKDVYEAAEIFFCNKEEAQKILNNTSNDMKELLDGVRALGPTIAVVTDGPTGAFASDGTGYWKMPMYPDPAPPVDRTGAGDSFSSTVVSMLAEGLPLPEALRRGPINSMSVVQHIGAQKGLLTRDQLEKYVEEAPESYKLEEL
ncbi:carbohydrate kinase family protein [Candidatus Kaiserbacteria bacterium]|nr:MAG: carbohydrate kinase family protein [Candidatus Kaiserbacteria bacterium]